MRSTSTQRVDSTSKPFKVSAGGSEVSTSPTIGSVLEELGVSLLGFGGMIVVMTPSSAMKGRFGCLLCSDWIKVEENTPPKQRTEK